MDIGYKFKFFVFCGVIFFQGLGFEQFYVGLVLKGGRWVACAEFEVWVIRISQSISYIWVLFILEWFLVLCWVLYVWLSLWQEGQIGGYLFWYFFF